jgi:HEAT repeat protein
VDIYLDDPHIKYRRAAVAALFAIGDEAGMDEVLRHFAYDPSLLVQFASVCALIDHYGPDVFAGDAETAILARNVLDRREGAERLAGRQRLIEQQRLRMWPRVTTGPLEIIEADSLRARADSLQ